MRLCLLNLLDSQSLASLSVFHQAHWHCPEGPVGHKIDDLEVLLGGRLGLRLELTVMILLCRLGEDVLRQSGIDLLVPSGVTLGWLQHILI